MFHCPQNSDLRENGFSYKWTFSTPSTLNMFKYFSLLKGNTDSKEMKQKRTPSTAFAMDDKLTNNCFWKHTEFFRVVYMPWLPPSWTYSVISSLDKKAACHKVRCIFSSVQIPQAQANSWHKQNRHRLTDSDLVRI